MGAGDVIVLREDARARKGNIFDGTDDYVLHDAHAVARVAANDTVGTYTAWIYIDNVSNQGCILSAGDNNAAAEFLQFHIEGGMLKIELTHGSTNQFEIRETTSSIASRTWTHVAIVQDGTSPVLYVDGKLVALTIIVGTDKTFWYDELTLVDKFAIGVLESNNTHTLDWKGAIGQVKYFNIALTAAEILVEFKGTAHTIRATPIETARVFDITMENDGITDSGSGADDGTLTGNAYYGGEVSTWSLAINRNVTGHAAEDMNTVIDGNKYVTVIKKGD